MTYETFYAETTESTDLREGLRIGIDKPFELGTEQTPALVPEHFEPPLPDSDLGTTILVDEPIGKLPVEEKPDTRVIYNSRISPYVILAFNPPRSRFEKSATEDLAVETEARDLKLENFGARVYQDTEIVGIPVHAFSNTESVTEDVIRDRVTSLAKRLAEKMPDRLHHDPILEFWAQ